MKKNRIRRSQPEEFSAPADPGLVTIYTLDVFEQECLLALMEMISIPLKTKQTNTQKNRTTISC